MNTDTKQQITDSEEISVKNQAANTVNSVVIVILLSILLSSTISISLSWWLTKEQMPEFIVIDIKKIVDNKKKELIDSYKNDNSPENLAKIDRDLLVFLNNLDHLISSYTSHKKRIILRKEAIIDGQYKDLTEDIEKELKEK